MKFIRFAVIALALAGLFTCASAASSAGLKGNNDFKAEDGIWLYKGKPFYSTTAHVIFHDFRKDRAQAIKDLKALKDAGFTVVEAYWQWGKDLDPNTNEYNFEVLDSFVLECKKVGLKNFVMFQQYVPDWLARKHGWGHIREDGELDIRVDDFYVFQPNWDYEVKRFYTSLIDHLKEHPEISENIIYWNMGGEYKPFKSHRQEQDWDYGYDEYTVKEFRKWLQAKGFTLQELKMRWGLPEKFSYESWDDVWPAKNLVNEDYVGRPMKMLRFGPNNWAAARWDWYDFRQEASWKDFRKSMDYVREAGDNRPMIHEYNIITPGGVLPFLRWSKLGARPGKDGIYQSSGTFDREFDYGALLRNLAMCKGASIPPWQSNEQKGNTPPHWMRRHAWTMIAMGGTGTHFWDWAGKGWGVMNPDRTPSEGYPEAVRINALHDFYGDLLNASKPMPNRIGVLALAEETFYLPRGHLSETIQLLNVLLMNGSGAEVAIITDDEVLYEDLSSYKVIVSPRQEHMRESVRVKLAEWVGDGGTLWLMPNSASRSEADELLPEQPGAPLNVVAGASSPTMGKLSFDSEDVYGLLGTVASATTAELIADIAGIPALWRNSYGKGTCYYQAADTAYLPGKDTPLAKDREALGYHLRVNAGEPPVSLLKEVLKSGGVEPYAQAFADAKATEPMDTIIVGIRNAEPGYLLFLIEGDNRVGNISIKLNPERLGLSGEFIAYLPTEPTEKHVLSAKSNWTFTTDLTQAEVKILHLLPAKKSAKWVNHYAKKNWSKVASTLPVIPDEGGLKPPSEIGKVDPGDLDKIQPKPYGDKWLLLDLTQHANRSLADEGKMENAKAFLGSVGVGDNDLRELPTGLQTFVGVPFQIIDPNENQASCLITKTTGRPWLGPLEFTDIQVNAKVKKIHWLYGTGWANFYQPVGYITYHYVDGTSVKENLVMRKNIMNWWGKADISSNPDLTLAWSGSTPAAQRNYTSVGLYHYAWENPYPEKEVKSIDISSYGGGACIITVAITAEK